MWRRSSARRAARPRRRLPGREALRVPSDCGSLDHDPHGRCCDSTSCTRGTAPARELTPAHRPRSASVRARSPFQQPPPLVQDSCSSSGSCAPCARTASPLRIPAIPSTDKAAAELRERGGALPRLCDARTPRRPRRLRLDDPGSCRGCCLAPLSAGLAPRFAVLTRPRVAAARQAFANRPSPFRPATAQAARPRRCLRVPTACARRSIATPRRCAARARPALACPRRDAAHGPRRRARRPARRARALRRLSLAAPRRARGGGARDALDTFDGSL